LVVRPASEADAVGIQNIGRRTVPPTYAFAGADYVTHGLESWWSDEAVLRSLHNTTVLAAVEGDDLVGVANIDAHVAPRAKRAARTAVPHHAPGGLGGVRDRCPRRVRSTRRRPSVRSSSPLPHRGDWSLRCEAGGSPSELTGRKSVVRYRCGRRTCQVLDLAWHRPRWFSSAPPVPQCGQLSLSRWHTQNE